LLHACSAVAGLVAGASGSEAILCHSITEENDAVVVMRGGGFSHRQKFIRAMFASLPILPCMKHISKLLLIITILGFASCAHHESTTQTSQTTTSTGYRK
jgi:hypothetical protein